MIHYFLEKPFHYLTIRLHSFHIRSGTSDISWRCTCAVHRSQHSPCQSDQIRGIIRTTIGTLIFWILCSYVRPWKYMWGTSFSFVNSWVWKITFERVKMFSVLTFSLTHLRHMILHSTEWHRQVSRSDYELMCSYVTAVSRKIDIFVIDLWK